jgi:anti-sigma factor RsiW
MDYLEGTLPARVRALLESHVEGCPRCRAFIASYLETPRIVRRATDHLPSPAQQRALRDFLRSHGGEGG